jgi:peptide/nickel transport system ATP-binding protein
MVDTISSSRCVLEIMDLTVAYQQDGQWLNAVHDVSLSIHAGETYGLVGESGSGKTTLVLAAMRYLGNTASIRRGEIHLGETDLLALTEDELRREWGSRIAFVPQNPQSSLNPTLRIGDQLVESINLQGDHSPKEAELRAIEWCEKVHLPDPERIAESYPHQISGGMQQRVMIAMALSTDPELLILDEPTTNLDVTTQVVILDLLNDLIREQEAGVLYVTHNLGVIAQICDRVAVMYASELVEDADTSELFNQPLHPYTQGLMDSIPQLGDTRQNIQLRAITGQIPSIGNSPAGCVFRDRCPAAIEICSTRPPLYQVSESRTSRCHRWKEIDQSEIDIHQAAASGKPAQFGVKDGSQTLEINDLSIHFPIRRSLREVIDRQPPKTVRAVNQVNLDILPASTVGLVGESGSGKTTIARGIMGLEPQSDGSIELLQIPLPKKLSQRDKETLRLLQIVFQNPHEALNPNLPIGKSIRRPLIRLAGLSKEEAGNKVGELLEAVRLSADYAVRYPGQLSGGELQRVALARAFAANPELLILDEPISSLDVSVQAAILNLVSELQSEHLNSMLFISHDLAIVGYLADQIAVIYLGSLMEITTPEALFQPPHHPYSEALLSAIPQADPARKGSPIHLSGEIPNPADLPSGCPFHTRCPRFLGDICTTTTPPWQIDQNSGKRIFCHIPLEELNADQSQIDLQGAAFPK